MTTSRDSNGERTRLALERWFDAVERGETPDLTACCEGDARIAESVAGILERNEDAVSLLTGGAEPDSIAQGRVIGDFRIVAALGEGGMGRVYLAEQQSLKRLVALKVLDEHALGDAHARLRFRREAEIAAQLDHPNIVPIYELTEQDGAIFIAMKWLTGPGLDQLDAPLDPDEAARIGSAIARALHQAHASGIIHRDVKPANLILDDGKPYIVDFGLARGEADPTLTRSGVVAGTLAYLAPERLSRTPVAFDPRSDLYSLGAALYEIVSGAPPFPSEEPEKLLRAILFHDPPPLKLPSRHEDLATIIRRAMDKEPARRFPTGDAFADDLDRYRRGDPIESRPSGLFTRLWKRARRRPGLAAAFAILTALLLVSLGLFLFYRMQAAVELQERIKNAFKPVEDRDLDTAHARVDSLLKEYPTDERVGDLARQLAGLDAVEDLLDLTLDRMAGRTEPSVAALAQVSERIAANDAAELELRRIELALALVDLYRGDSAAVLRRVDALEGTPGSHQGGRGRDTAALRAAATNGTFPSLAELKGTSSDEHVFAAAAMRWMHAPPQDQLAEIDAALALDEAHHRTHDRARYARAVFQAENATLAEAEAAFRVIPRTARTDPMIRLNLARIRMLAGDPASALRELEPVHESKRDALMTLLISEIQARMGQADAARKTLGDALARWPGDAEVALRAGQMEYDVGNRKGALAYFEAASRSAVAPRVKELAESLEILTGIADIANKNDPTETIELDAAKQRALAQLDQAATHLADSARYARARSRALAAAAWAANLLGDPPRAIALLEEAVNADEGHHAARSFLVGLLVDHAPDSPLSPEDRSRLETADRHAEKLCASENRGWDPPDKARTDWAYLARAAIASLLRDKARYRVAAERALARLAPDDPRVPVIKSLDWADEKR